ncbi:acyl-homoserine-lactone synthase [Roseateles flavus]|uniref:Acyl-homoserine-lactone synthase n=1 Tax=Roseateles flavus TaxID=3149041 RepID=A0ABV0GH69_9BURK
MRIHRYADSALSAATRTELAAYRYDVFVGRLGWDLPCRPGCDQDQFDKADAVHLVARSEEGRVIGYARLLPTEGSYLLGELFPQLLSGHQPPRDAQVWELSRYAAMDIVQQGLPGASAADLLVGKQLLLQAIRTAAQSGARRLIFCTTVAIERLAMRWGVDIQRLGAPLRSEGQLLVAAMIEFSDKTFEALAPASQVDHPHPAPLPFACSTLQLAAA